MRPSFSRAVDDLAAMVGGLDIAGQKHGLAPGLLDQALRFLCIVMLFDIADHISAPSRAHKQSRPPGYGAASAGDHGPYAREFAGPVGLLAMILLRPHGIRFARHRLLLAGKGRSGMFVICTCLGRPPRQSVWC